MDVMIRNCVTLFFEQFPVCMTIFALILGLLFSFFRKERSISDIFLGKLFFFAVGLTGIWGFVMHAFFPEMAAKFIGWATSPFQFEVAVANLGMGVAGIFGSRATKPYRIATAIFTTCFLWGAAYGHVIQMADMHNFAPGNAGSIFYNDTFLPLLLIIFLACNSDEKCKD